MAYVWIIISIILGYTRMIEGYSKPIGITNAGNSCFVSASLQALLVTPFFEQVSRIAHDKSCNSTELLTQLNSFYQGYTASAGSNKPNVYYDAGNLYKLFVQEKIVIAQGKKGDSSEFTSRLIERHNDPIERELKKTNLTIAISSCRINLFDFTIAYVQVCQTCHAEKLSPEEMQAFLSIPIQTGTLHTLQEAIIQSFREQAVNNVQCTQCNKKTTHIRQLRITHIPQILMLFTPIVKSASEPEYLSEPVQASQKLDIAPWTTEKENTTYTLSAIVCHGSDHYTALVHYPSGWYHCSDSSIFGPIDDIQAVLQQGQYQGFNFSLFFYMRNTTSSPSTEETTKLELLETQLSLVAALAPFARERIL